MLLRYSVSATLGLVTALFLLWLMQTLVASQRSGQTGDREQLPVFDFVRVKETNPLRLRKRKLPDQPKQPRLLPRPSVDLKQPEIHATAASPKLAMPLDLAMDLGDGPYIGPMGQVQIDQGVIVLSRTPPQYPMQAKRRKIEGWVKLGFTVTASGTVKDVEVIESSPPGVFDRSAVRAVYKWTFRPQTVAGTPVETHAEQTLEFRLH